MIGERSGLFRAGKKPSLHYCNQRLGVIKLPCVRSINKTYIKKGDDSMKAKKILALILCLVMCMSLVPAAAFADDGGGYL